MDRLFLYDKGANPDKTNMKKETSLHCCCMERNSQFYNVQKRRVECLQMIINWRGGTLQDGQVEKVNIAAVDEVGTVYLSLHTSYFFISFVMEEHCLLLPISYDFLCYVGTLLTYTHLL